MRTVAGVVAILLCSACTGTPTATSSGEAIADLYRDGSLSSHQRAVAARIDNGADVTLEDYLTAKREQVECISDAGVVVSDVKHVMRQGHEVVDFYVNSSETADRGIDQAQVDEIVAECSATYSDYVEALWATSPATQEWVDALLERYRPALEACLQSHGVDTSGLRSMADVQRASGELLASEENFSGPDCGAETGLSSALLEGS